MKEKHVFFIYEVAQVPLASAYKENTIVALSLEVELELRRQNLPYTSVRDLATSPEGQREPLEFARRLAHDWYQLPEFSFFSYQGILLGEQHEVMVSYYLQALIYYFKILRQSFEHLGPISAVTIPESWEHVPATADATAAFKVRLPVDLTRLLAAQQGIPCTILPAPLQQEVRNRFGYDISAARQLVIRTAVGIVNTASRMFSRSRAIKLLSTDPWYRIAPVMQFLPEAELVMSRRKEIQTVGWKNILSTRTRFYHRLDFANKSVRIRARHHMQEMKQAWEALGEHPHIAERSNYEGISFWSVARPMFEHLVTHDVENAVMMIESTKRMLSYNQINCVLLFGSTKGHDNILARVSEQLKIPSIELQHALETVEPSFLAHSRLPAKYLAAYGALTKKHYLAFGAQPWQILECGSPRFDTYRPAPLAKVNLLRSTLSLRKPLTILALVPYVDVGLEHGLFSTYKAWDVLTDMAALESSVPSAHVLIRPRPGQLGSRLYQQHEVRDVFSPDARFVQYEDMRTLLTLSDVVISGNSTVVLEAMLLRRPVITYMPRLTDHDYDEYVAAGALLLARTREELLERVNFLKDSHNRKVLLERADTFLHNNFAQLLDGKSSERIASLVHSVTSTEGYSIMSV